MKKFIAVVAVLLSLSTVTFAKEAKIDYYPVITKEFHENIKYDFNIDSLRQSLNGVEGQIRLDEKYIKDVQNLADIKDSVIRENKFIKITRNYIFNTHQNIGKSHFDEETRQKIYHNFNRKIQMILVENGHISFTI